MSDNQESISSMLTNPVFLSVVIVVLIAVLAYFIYEYIKKRNESIRRINMMTNIDDLTHLYKRKFFYTLFESELERARRHDRDLSCAIIEIDNFDELKETYGEQFCNLVVQDIGETFTDDTRIHDICARYGDYSFASLMPESDLEAAMYVCKRLRGSVEGSKFAMEGSKKLIRVTISIGLISCDDFMDNEEIGPDAILEMASQAMNIAKQEGGNQVQCYVNLDGDEDS